jgi:hypothetical protein
MEQEQAARRTRGDWSTKERDKAPWRLPAPQRRLGDPVHLRCRPHPQGARWPCEERREGRA